MSVGNQPTKATVDNILSSLAVQLRGACNQIRWQYTFISSLGTAGLEALGYTAADAQTMLTMMGYLNNVASIYYGTGTQATASDFDAALAPYWCGQ